MRTNILSASFQSQFFSPVLRNFLYRSQEHFAFLYIKTVHYKKKKKKKIGQNLDFPIKLPGMIIPKSKVYSELQQCKSFNPDLLTRIIQLESNTVTNSQYSRRETIELNPVPAEIHEGILEESICKALSLTGVNVVPENL